MSANITHITDALRSARHDKHLSQRELSQLAGMQQGHLSRIENGAVDLKLSSLIELARLLDLEVMLTPRQLVPAVSSIIRGSGTSGDADELRSVYQLDEPDDD
jgi:transcriptional regulator with XRE-family HTH domain